MTKDITVIITTWNSLEFLKLCLDKLYQYTDHPFRIIISDNGSTDGTQGFVSTQMGLHGNQIQYIRSEINKGTIDALVRAEPFIKSKYVVILDSDSIVSRNWLSPIIKIVTDDRRIKIVGPMKQGTQYKYPYGMKEGSRKVWDEVKTKNQGKTPEELLNIYCNGKSYDDFVSDFIDTNRGSEKLLRCPPELLSGCCLFMDFDFISQHGGITNPVFYKYGGHDADRCWRVGKAGGLVLKTDKAYVHHFEGSSLKKNNLEYRPLLYDNNRKLLDMWTKEIWEFIDASGKTLSDLAQKYWMIRELLLSANKDQIPCKYITQFEEVRKSFISTV
jgi:GT2 family glycosyltransferase